MIITLCGSTRFKEEFERINRELTLQGHIVISVGVFGHSGDELTKEQKERLDEIHKRKIDMSDAIYVINKDGYIGDSTRSEIEYARALGKEIMYMERNIRHVCEKLADIWEQVPDWRLGQFLFNILYDYKFQMKHDVFYIEDEELLKHFDSYIKTIRGTK